VTHVGIIAFAFGQQVTQTAGPSNDAIAKVTLEVKDQERNDGHPVLLVTQWEVALSCIERFEPPDLAVSAYDDPSTNYLTTKEVLDLGLQYFQSRGVRRVILIAHPLHMLLIRTLLTAKAWKVGNAMIDWSYGDRMSTIPYDKSSGNRQWWTRGPVSFLWYVLRAVFTKKHGS